MVERRIEYSHSELKQITPEQYETAYQNLNNFSAMNVEEISNLQDLSGRIRVLGNSLREVALSIGEIRERGDTVIDPEELILARNELVVEKPLEDGTISLRMTRDFAFFDRNGNENQLLFSVSLPLDTDLTQKSNVHPDDQSVVVHDYRSMRDSSFYPEMHFDDLVEVQTYAKFLQEGVRDLVKGLTPTDSS